MTSNILHRYLLRECAKTWSVVIAVLLVLTLGAAFTRFIARAAAGELPADVVLAVAGYSALENLEIVLPVSLLLAILLTVGRLCRDNEMTAMTAGGVGLARLYRPFLVFALLLAIAAAGLSLSIGPGAGRAMKRLQGVADTLAMESLEPGRFHTLLDGRAVFYAETMDAAGGRMHDVFIRVRQPAASGTEAAGETVVVADRAWQRYDAATGRRTLVLRDGWRYEGSPDRADYRVTRFTEHGVRIAAPAARVEFNLTDVPVSELMARDGPGVGAEWHRRLGVPVSVLVLALLALPLGQAPPRSGRYGRLVVGILLYVGYVNVLRLAGVWLAQGETPAALGLWWVHAGMLTLALSLVARRQGRLRLPVPGVRA